MGQTVSTVVNHLSNKKEARILMLGLDAAGKTTILYKLKLGEVTTTVPTFGLNMEIVEFKNFKLYCWDVGYQQRIRVIWRHFFENIQGILFVIDSWDKERMDLVKEEVQWFLGEEKLKKAVLLIMANKQDLSGAMTVAEMTEKLELSLIKGRESYIRGTCAVSGEGLREGLDWLTETINSNK